MVSIPFCAKGTLAEQGRKWYNIDMKRTGQLIFIDDSGDPGFKEGVSSSNFILAAALFIDSETAKLVNETIAEYRHSLGWRDGHEFKFRTTTKDIKLQFLRNVCKFPFEIYAVYLNKASHPNVFKFSDGEKLYNWATKELLATMPLEEAKVKIDGKYGKQYKLRVKTYIRKELNTEVRKVADFGVQDSKRDNLIQLADIIAGSINRALQPEKTDSEEYVHILKKKIVSLKKLDLDAK